MKLRTHLASLVILMAALISSGCDKHGPPKPPSTPTPGPSPTATVPTRLHARTEKEKEVTFYPTYGYRSGTDWKARLRGWVHKDHEHRAEFAAKVLQHFAKCDDTQMDIVRSRSADIMDDNKENEEVEVKFYFDPDDKAYPLVEPKDDGIVTLDLTLTDEKAKQLLEKQGSSNGWLTYRAVSKNHIGLGRVRLIEPDPNGVSLVTDIDDTIKITEVPAGQPTVLRNTFCLDFRPVRDPDMAAKYKALGDIPVHYVSGGPEQLFGPLYDFLITGSGGFPEGTFHLNFFSTHFSLDSVNHLMESLGSSLQATYKHKHDTITTLMQKFPDRKFILVGDSGEVDPEVYNEIKSQRPAQVKEIWIRDVINDDIVNHFRLAGMTVIPVNPPVCIEDKQFDKLSEKMKQFHTETYNRNPACGKGKKG